MGLALEFPSSSRCPGAPRHDPAPHLAPEQSLRPPLAVVARRRSAGHDPRPPPGRRLPLLPQGDAGRHDRIETIVVGPGGTWTILRAGLHGRFRKRNGHWYRWNRSTDSWIPWDAEAVNEARLTGHRLELYLERATLPASVEAHPVPRVRHGSQLAARPGARHPCRDATSTASRARISARRGADAGAGRPDRRAARSAAAASPPGHLQPAGLNPLPPGLIPRGRDAGLPYDPAPMTASERAPTVAGLILRGNAAAAAIARRSPAAWRSSPPGSCRPWRSSSSGRCSSWSRAGSLVGLAAATRSPPPGRLGPRDRPLGRPVGPPRLLALVLLGGYSRETIFLAAAVLMAPLPVAAWRAGTSCSRPSCATGARAPAQRRCLRGRRPVGGVRRADAGQSGCGIRPTRA